MEFTVEEPAKYSNLGWGAGTVDGGVQQHGGEIPAGVTDSVSSTGSGVGVVPDELQSSEVQQICCLVGIHHVQQGQCKQEQCSMVDSQLHLLHHLQLTSVLKMNHCISEIWQKYTRRLQRWNWHWILKVKLC